MRPSRFLMVVCVALAVVLSLSGVGPAQTVKVLYSFDGTVGTEPLYVNLVQGLDGQLYGTTEFGGPGGRGSVFKIDTAGKATLLHGFSQSQTEGGNPVSGLTLGTDGNFYGTAPRGGSAGGGVVFKMTPTGNLTDIYSFALATGYGPYSPPLQATDNNFYGTTFNGGSEEMGGVYQFTAAGEYTVL